MRPRFRALLLLITALGLALGLATASTHDRPVAVANLDVLCVAVVEAAAATGAAAVGAAASTAGALSDALAPELVALLVVLAAAAAVAIVCFLLVVRAWRSPELARSGPGVVAAEVGRPRQRSARPLLSQLSVLRI